jgi:hypothetical protein
MIICYSRYNIDMAIKYNIYIYNIYIYIYIYVERDGERERENILCVYIYILYIYIYIYICNLHTDVFNIYIIQYILYARFLFCCRFLSNYTIQSQFSEFIYLQRKKNYHNPWHHVERI